MEVWHCSERGPQASSPAEGRGRTTLTTGGRYGALEERLPRTGTLAVEPIWMVALGVQQPDDEQFTCLGLLVEDPVGKLPHPGSAEFVEPVDRGRAQGEHHNALDGRVDAVDEPRTKLLINPCVIGEGPFYVAHRLRGEDDPQRAPRSLSRTSDQPCPEAGSA